MSYNRTSKDRFAKYNSDDPYVRNLFERKKQRIDIQYLPTGDIVRFRAFVSEMPMTFSPMWNDNDDVYGRMDSISIFKKTKRSHTISWDIPSYSWEDAEQNLEAINLLVQMLYPVYETILPRDISNYNNNPSKRYDDVYYQQKVASANVSKRAKQAVLKRKDVSTATAAKHGLLHLTAPKDLTLDYGGYGVGNGTLKSAPLLKLKMSNLITDTRKDLPQNVGITGVICKPSNLTVTPVMEAGFFDPNVFLLPKLMRVTLTIDVIHGHQVGWEAINHNFLGGSEFPMGEIRTERAARNKQSD